MSSRYLSKKTGDISYTICFSEEEIPGYVVISAAYADRKEFSFRFMYHAEE